jgi:hypothetical protein
MYQIILGGSFFGAIAFFAIQLYLAFKEKRQVKRRKP